MSALLVIMAVRVTAGTTASTAAAQWNTTETTARKVRRIYQASGSAVHITPEKCENAALFLRFDLPSTLIRPENEAFRK